jgi:hypothetical protein
VSALSREESAARSGGVEILYGGSQQARDNAFRRSTTDLVELRCECGYPSCNATIVLSLDEYQTVRQDPTHFLIKEGHEVAEVVRVMGYGPDYVVGAALRDASIGGL